MVVIRPLLAQDGPALRAFVEGLSPASRYERFQYVVKEVSPALLRLLVEGVRSAQISVPCPLDSSRFAFLNPACRSSKGTFGSRPWNSSARVKSWSFG